MDQSTSAENWGQAAPLSLPQAASTDPIAADELILIIRDAARRTAAQTALLAISGATPERLHSVCWWGVDASAARLAQPVPRAGFVGHVIETGRTRGDSITPQQEPLLTSAASGAPVTYAAGAPVRPPGGPWGALCVGLAARPHDTAATIWVVESYARLAALCLHDAGTLEGLLAAARLDALTGCLNHAAIRTELERELVRCARHQHTMACCFIDLDHFKLVNDRYGHEHGSRVLAEVAAVLRAAVRAGDSVGRYGGDEFIVLLPDANGDIAHRIAQRLRRMIRAITIKGEPQQLDASVGVAQWLPGATADALLQAADDALRSAKRAGRGDVVRAGDEAVAEQTSRIRR